MSTLFSTKQASTTTFSKTSAQQQTIEQYHVKPANSRNSKPKQPRYRQRLQALALCVSLAFGMGMVSSAHAHCSFAHPGHCVNDVRNFVEDRIIDPIGKTILSSGQKIEKFSETQFVYAKYFVESGLEEVKDLVEDIAVDTYQQMSEIFVSQIKEPLENMARAWKSLSDNHNDNLKALKSAVRSRDAAAINAALQSNLEHLFAFAGFNDILEDFENKGAGSLLLIFSAGGGAGVTAEVDVGLAIDVDFLAHAYEQYSLSGVTFAEAMETSPFKGPVASLFTAAGVQIGPAAGGGADLVVGYHVADPNDVYGPGFDLSLEITTAVGGSIGVGWDASKAPWQIVTAGIGIGPGAELKFAVGPSYAVVLGQLCSDATFGPRAEYCLIDSTTGVPIRARQNNKKCMHKKNKDVKNGNRIHLWNGCDKTGNPNRGWFYEESTGYIRLAADPTKCLVKEGRGDEWGHGKIAHLWDCDGGIQENKKWTYEESTGYIRSRHNSNSCLQKKRSNWFNGNDIHIWSCDQGSKNNKTWSIDTNL